MQSSFDKSCFCDNVIPSRLILLCQGAGGGGGTSKGGGGGSGAVCAIVLNLTPPAYFDNNFNPETH
jgi:hypothetical protein